MTRRAFWRRYGRIEHERLEFKRSANHICESVVAMAMTAGGTILVGVTDERRLAGCAVEQPTLDRIAGVADETQVDLGLECIAVGGVTVLAIAVPAVAPRVVTTPDGRLLRRVGGSNRPLRGEGVLRFLGERPVDRAVAAGLGSG